MNAEGKKGNKAEPYMGGPVENQKKKGGVGNGKNLQAPT